MSSPTQRPPRRKASAPTIPAPSDADVLAFEERIRTSNEWRARTENLCALLSTTPTGENERNPSR